MENTATPHFFLGALTAAVHVVLRVTQFIPKASGRRESDEAAINEE